MAVKCEQYNGVCVVAVDGDLSGEAVAALRRAVAEAMERQQTADFVVDLEKCPFIDSEGLEALLWAKQKAEELFGQTKLANVDESCRKILEITRQAGRFDCQGDLAAALKTMR